MSLACLAPWAAVAALLVSVGLVLRHRCGRDLRAARARVATGGHVAPGPRGPIEYGETGHGDPILVVHGSAGGFDQGLEMALPLSRRGWRIIAPSRAGYLRSTLPPDHTVEAQADDFAALLDHLGVASVAVAGVSAGAWSAIAFARRHPGRCRALMLLVPADHLPSGVNLRGGPISDLLLRSDLFAWLTIQAVIHAPAFVSRRALGTAPDVVRHAAPDERQRMHDLQAHLLPIAERRPGLLFDLRTARQRPPMALDGVRCPVLALSAEDDGFETAARARAIAAAVPGSRLVIYPRGGHGLVGCFPQALDEVHTFLTALPPAPATVEPSTARP